MKYSSSSMVSPLGGASNKSESSSSYQSKSYSASSSSVDGGLPHYSSSSDSVYKSTRTGEARVGNRKNNLIREGFKKKYIWNFPYKVVGWV